MYFLPKVYGAAVPGLNLLSGISPYRLGDEDGFLIAAAHPETLAAVTQALVADVSDRSAVGWQETSHPAIWRLQVRRPSPALRAALLRAERRRRAAGGPPVDGGDQRMIDAFIDRSMEELRGRGLAVTLDEDIGAWAAHMRGAPGITAVNPTFDPQESRVDPANSLWIKATDGRGAIIGCTAVRLFETADFRELALSQALWFDRGRRALSPITLTMPDGLGISGRVAHEGGMWVHPEHRRNGLARFLCPLVRAVAMQEWHIDWYTGISVDALITSSFFAKGYHYSLICPFIEGFCPPLGRDQTMWLTYMSRAESLQQMRTWMDKVGSAPPPRLERIAA